jgi:hypothetical protein
MELGENVYAGRCHASSTLLCQYSHGILLTCVTASKLRMSINHPPTHTYMPPPPLTPPGQYFYSTRAAIQYYPEWTSFQELYQRASQTSKALQEAFAGRSAFTYLLPNNDALRPAMQVGTVYSSCCGVYASAPVLSR